MHRRTPLQLGRGEPHRRPHHTHTVTHTRCRCRSHGRPQAANTCTALARLGVDATLVTALGDDLTGGSILTQV